MQKYVQAMAEVARCSAEIETQRRHAEALTREADARRAGLEARLEAEAAADAAKALQSRSRLLRFRSTFSAAGAAAASASTASAPRAEAGADGDVQAVTEADGEMQSGGMQLAPPSCVHCGYVEVARVRCLPGPLGSRTLCNACGLRWRSAGKATPDCKQCGGTFTSAAAKGSACEHKSVEKTKKRREGPAGSSRAKSSKGCDGGSGECGEDEEPRRQCEYRGCKKTMVRAPARARSAARSALRRAPTPLACSPACPQTLRSKNKFCTAHKRTLAERGDMHLLADTMGALEAGRLMLDEAVKKESGEGSDCILLP